MRLETMLTGCLMAAAVECGVAVASEPPGTPSPTAPERELYVVATAHLDTQWR